MKPDLLGATPLGEDRCRFVVWAPWSGQVQVSMQDGRRLEPMTPVGSGYHRAELDGVRAGTRYRYVVDGATELADPASRRQPEGVHGPSVVDDPSAFSWSDRHWRGMPSSMYVLYEVHVGTFTPEGTFDAAIEHLRDLAELGVTAVELMPVCSFPGDRDWGYDGVFPFAVQESYGGPDGLRRFVDACHGAALAVVLDVVHNHLGPEGNVLASFGPYFTDRYRNPWGDAINVDGPGSDEVRRFFRESVAMWFRDFHADGLRLDAIDAIVDTSPEPFLTEVAADVDRISADVGRPLFAFAESDRNDPRVVMGRDRNGLGMHAQWTDDLHRALFALLTGVGNGYYSDFGSLDDLATALAQGWVLDGRPSRARGRRWGGSPAGLAGETFVVALQNHDQIGNRPRGERLSTLVGIEEQKLAAAAVLLSPFLPLLFMGEEYGETAPFPFFTSFDAPTIGEIVRAGRRRELDAKGWTGEPFDPQDPATRDIAVLDRRLRGKEPHRALEALNRKLLRLRRELPALRDLAPDRARVLVDEHAGAVVTRRASPQGDVFVALAFGERDTEIVAVPEGTWELVVDTADRRWEGPGGRAPATLAAPPLPVARRSAVVYRERPG